MTRRFYPPTASDLGLHGGVQGRVYGDMHRERIRAHEKHDANGDSMERKTFDDPRFVTTVTEEVGEVCRALNDHLSGPRDRLAKEMRGELVQLGAMVAAWIDAVDLDDELEAQRIAEHRKRCEGFHWVGQSLRACDRCSRPAWEHAGEMVPGETVGNMKLRPWREGEAEAIRRKWDPTYRNKS